MLIEDVSGYDLIQSKGSPKYLITLDDSEVKTDILLSIFNAFKWANMTVIDNNQFIIGGNLTSSGDFTSTMKEYRKNVFTALSNIDDSISIDTKLSPLKSFTDVLNAQYEESFKILQETDDLTEMEETYFYVHSFDNKITSVRIGKSNFDVTPENGAYIDIVADKQNVSRYQPGKHFMKMSHDIVKMLEYLTKKKMAAYAA